MLCCGPLTVLPQPVQPTDPARIDDHSRHRASRIASWQSHRSPIRALGSSNGIMAGQAFADAHRFAVV
jgi:hypothetical protein